jgi:dolichol-phosphate mannosyltransferase
VSTLTTISSDKIELALVMPVYNEEECITCVVTDWYNEMRRLDIDFVMIVINDGSKDGTLKKLEQFVSDERIMVINKENSGHGPTILHGYNLAADLADWVFQTDSDDEMSPESFHELWERRHSYDALFGSRTERIQGRGRKFITVTSRFIVRILFGKGVNDVNTPYRLLRGDVLIDMLSKIPDDTFAPNIIISGLLSATGARIYNHPVVHKCRRSGAVSIVKLRLWKAALKSFRQTISVALYSKRQHLSGS